MSDADITAAATVALAVVGIISIATGIALSIGTFRAAGAARDATALQQRQADLLERELKLAEQQATATREAARPKLRASVESAGNVFLEVSLHYISGTEPATDIQVWVRRQPGDEGGWGLFVWWVGYIAPGERFSNRMTSASAQEQERLPFLDFLTEQPTANELFVGLVWKRPDGEVSQLAQRQFTGGVKPPEQFHRE